MSAEGNEGKGTLTGHCPNNDYAGHGRTVPCHFGTINIGEWKEVNVTTPSDGLNQMLSALTSVL